MHRASAEGHQLFHYGGNEPLASLQPLVALLRLLTVGRVQLALEAHWPPPDEFLLVAEEQPYTLPARDWRATTNERAYALQVAGEALDWADFAQHLFGAAPVDDAVYRIEVAT
jgi:hypothetical protein